VSDSQDPEVAGGISGPGLDHDAEVALEELRRVFGDRWAIVFTPQGAWEAKPRPPQPVTAASLSELRAKLLARETGEHPLGS
jgi:hypothetical protein